jgi:hypothetical protein
MQLSEPTFSYWTVQPNRWTFAATKIRAWVESHLQGRVLNACCGVTELDHHDEIKRNDIQQQIRHNGTLHETNADTNLDARRLTDHYAPDSFDTIVFDPPFSQNQAQSTYNLHRDQTPDTTAHEELDRLLKPDGRLIQMGFSSTVFPRHPHYDTSHVALWNLFGRQHDWFGTVAERHPDPHEQTLPEHHHTEVVPNPVEDVPALEDTNVTASGNDGIPIPLSYTRLPSETSLKTAVAEAVADTLAGHALIVGESVGHYHDAYDGPLTANTTSPRYAFDTRYALQQLSDAYPEGTFDHIVLDLPPGATNKTVQYQGSTTGYDTAAKAEAHPLLTDHGAITIVGHSATTMSQLTYEEYIRHRVSVLSHPDKDRDTIIATDRLDTTRTRFPTRAEQAGSKPSTPPSDIDTEPGASVATPNWVCDNCSESWYRHSALHVDCLDCGARPGNYCVDTNGTPLSTIHTHRVASWQQSHLRTHSVTPLATNDSLDASSSFGSTTPADGQQHLSNFQ